MMSFEDENVFFLSDFDDNMERDIVIPLTRQIQKQKNVKDGRIDLYVNSFGGYAHLSDHIVQLMELAKREGIVVRTIVPAIAFSAGSFVAVAGTPGERYISRVGEHLIHYGTTGSAESTPLQIDRFTDWKKRGFKVSLDHYAKYAKIPNLDAEMMDDGFFVPAAKCIKWGLADKYMDKLDIGEFRTF